MPMKIECQDCCGYSLFMRCWVDENGKQCRSCGGTNTRTVYTQTEYDEAVKSARIEELKRTLECYRPLRPMDVIARVKELES